MTGERECATGDPTTAQDLVMPLSALRLGPVDGVALLHVILVRVREMGDALLVGEEVQPVAVRRVECGLDGGSPGRTDGAGRQTDLLVRVVLRRVGALLRGRPHVALALADVGDGRV